MTSKELPTLNKCVEKLTQLLIQKKDELYRRENSCGTYHDVHKMTKLRGEIPSIEHRLRRAERLQDEALTSQS